jgi:hypothetical protein
MADDTRPLEERRISGVISGFDQYKTDSDNPDQAQSPHEYSLVDFYNKLRELLTLLDKVQLERIETLINKHIYNYQNPHRDTLESLGIDILNELYQLWLQTEPTTPELTYDFFIKLLFQYVEIASVDETLNNLAPNKVVSVLGLIKLIDKHNLDPNAHQTLIERLCPGDPIDATPIFAWHSFYGLPRTKTIELPYTLDKVKTLLNEKYAVTIHDYEKNYYIQSDYKLHKLKDNDPPIEWIGDNPYWSLWNVSTNLINYSEDFSTYTKTNSDITSVVDSPNIDIANSFRLTETTGAIDTLHSIRPNQTFTVTANQVLTASIFFKATDTTRQYACIKFTHSTLDSTYMFAQFDLDQTDPKVFMTDSYTSNLYAQAHIVRLAEGWYRCGYTLKFTAAGTVTVDFGALDILGGDLIYHNDTGDSPNGILLYGAQVETLTAPSPYMRTTSEAVTRSTNSVIWIPIYPNNQYNYNEGTLVVNYLNNHIVQSDTLTNYTAAKIEFENGRTILQSSLRSLNNKYIFRNTIANTSNNNIIIDTETSLLNPYSLLLGATTFKKNEGIFTYLTDYESSHYYTESNTTSLAKEGLYKYGTNYPHIVLGNTDTNDNLNGYFQSIIYYPVALTAAKAKSIIDFTKII